MTDPAMSGLILIFINKSTNIKWNNHLLLWFLQNMTGSGEDLRVSSDSLESDLGDRDSLESRPCSEDSLQIIGDSLGSNI